MRCFMAFFFTAVMVVEVNDSVYYQTETANQVTSFPNQDAEDGIRPTIFIVFFILLLGLIAHILAFVATRKSKKLWKEEQHNPVPYFLLNVLLKIDFIAVVFFLLRGFATPLFLSNLTFRCEFSLSTNIIFTWTSGFANVAMCLERCFALMAPFLYLKHVTLFRAKVVLTIMISLAILIPVLPIFGFSSYRVLDEKLDSYICLSPGAPYVEGVNFVVHYTVVFFVVGFSTVITIVIGNMVVVFYIMKLQRKIAPIRAPQIRIQATSSTSTQAARQGSRSLEGKEEGLDEGAKRNSLQAASEEEIQTTSRDTAANTNNKREIRLATMFVIVSIVYTISWLPLYIDRFMSAVRIPSADIISRLTIWLLTVNHCIDPVIFVFFKKKNRKALKLAMINCCCCFSKEYREDATQTVLVEMQTMS